MKYKNNIVSKLQKSYQIEKTVSRLLEKQTEASVKFTTVNKSILELLKESRKQMDQINLLIRSRE
jgi:hypothetical protein